jgi:hypothetical protein
LDGKIWWIFISEYQRLLWLQDFFMIIH